jgi:ribonuclease VapC
MTVDSSALLAILREEPECDQFIDLIDQDPGCIISAATVLEASIVVAGRKVDPGHTRLDAFLFRGRIRIVPFDADQLVEARAAFQRFGKGRHPAALNFGDCISYALSMTTGEPLLFKGRHFSQTDVTPAL